MQLIITSDVRLNNIDTRSTHMLGLFTNLCKFLDVYLFVPKIRNLIFFDSHIKYIPRLWLPLIGTISYQISLFFYLFVFCLRSRVDAIYNRQDNYSISPLIVSKLLKIPFFVEVNGLLTNESKLIKTSKLYLMLVCFSEKYNYSHANKIFVVSEGIKQGIIRLYNISPDKIIFIENGTDAELFKPIDKKEINLTFDDTYKYIGFVGSFAPWHGLDSLIKSAPLVIKQYPRVKYVLVGDGPLKYEILKMIREFDLEEHFILTGKVLHEKIPMYINIFDVCVILKKKDIPGSPLKLYEYLSCGKPVIATNSEDFKALTEYEAGILVDPDNLQELSSKLIYILQNEILCGTMGRNARNYILKHRTWFNVAEDIFNNLQ